MIKIATRLLLFPILSLAFADIRAEQPTVSAEFQTGKAWSEDSQLLLELAIVEPPARTFESVVLKLTATNAGKKKMFLDRELSIGFDLNFVTDLEREGEIRVLPDPRLVDYVNEQTATRPTVEQAKSRIAELAPGKSLTRIIKFRDPIRSGGMGRAYVSDGSGGFFDYETFSESSANLKFPDEATTIKIRVFYERGFGWTPDSVLEDWFGIPVKDLGEPWNGRAISAPLTLSLRRKQVTERSDAPKERAPRLENGTSTPVPR